MSTVEKKIFRNVSVRVNGETMTRRARKVTVAATATEEDVTTFGGNGWQEIEQGLKSGTITVEFFQGDYGDATSVDSVIRPFWDSGDECEIRIGPEGDTGASDNPVFVAPVKVMNYTYIDAEVAKPTIAPIEFRLTDAPSIDTT